MKRINKLCAAALLCCSLCLTACTTVQDEPLSIHLTPEAVTTLPDLYLPAKISAQQLLTIHYGSESHQIIAMLQGQGDILKLTILTPAGVRLYDAEYTAGQLTTRSFISADKLPPASQVLFDIMLCLLPAEDFSAVLPPGFVLKDEGLTRLLYDGDNLVYRIEFKETAEGGREVTRIAHQIFHYQIDFKTL